MIDRLAMRAKIHLDDRLRFSRSLSELLAVSQLGAHVLRSGGRFRIAEPSGAGHLFNAARFTRSPKLRSVLNGAVADWVRTSKPNQQPVVAPHGELVNAPAVLLLKAPGPAGEKGLLFAGNEGPWPAIVRAARGTDLLHRYDLVALSAWSPPKYEKLAQFVGLSPDPVLVGVSNVDDFEGYRLLAPAIEPLPLMASDWLHPDDFRPRPKTDRDIDVLMVAGWGRYKRHWLLFGALRGLDPALNVVLIGRDSGSRTLADVQKEARMFGVRQNITFLSDVPIHEVYDYQARARVSVIFTGREGACVAITESFFADTPVGVMRDAHVGAKAHINPATGVLFEREKLASQLGRFIDESAGFEARAWACEHISCHRSSVRLNAMLANRAAAGGRPWTAGIAPLFRRYFVPRYVNREDGEALQSDIIKLREVYGLELPPVESADQ